MFLFELLFLHLRSTKRRFCFPLWKPRWTINQSIPEKGILSPMQRSTRSELRPPAMRLAVGASSAEPHTHAQIKIKKICKSLFVMLQRWNGQAWAVTLDPPWLRSLLTQTWGPTAVQMSELMLTSLQSPQRSEASQAPSLNLGLSQSLLQPFAVSLFASR